MYQPELGRFLQPDPKEFGAGDYNLYRYCHNDPVNKTDPTGLIVSIEGDEKFKVKVAEDIDQTRKLNPALNDSYKELNNSPRTHTIKQAESGKGNSNKVEGFWNRLKSLFGGRTGSTTYYDPNNRHTSYGDRDPKAALAHEFFGHALDRDRGTWSNQTLPQPPSELRAIWFENQARQAIDGSQRSYDYYHPSVTYP